jgi:uncharacterized protein (DUF1697 family)
MTTTTIIALLRAINVAGHATVAMSDLRALLADLGFADVRSLLQTGNLVFRSDAPAAAELERRLEAAAAERLGLRTDFLVRTADEWAAAVQRNPLPDVATQEPGRLVVMFLKQAPDQAAVAALQAAVKGPEVIRAAGRQLYISYPDGIGRSRLTTGLIESRLGTRGTGRNWNTVRKLDALVRA